MADAQRNNPRSVGRPRKQDDSNLPDHILGVAIRLYADDGFEKVTFKDIAREAGVATSLISHHFGDKAGFRAACNRHVLDEMNALLDRVILALEQDADMNAFVNLISGISADRVHVLRYLTLLFLHEDDEANSFFRAYFDKFHEVILHLKERGMIRDDMDPVWITLTRIFAQLGPVFLYRQVSDIIGEDPYAPEAAKRRLDTVTKMFRTGALKPGVPGTEAD